MTLKYYSGEKQSQDVFQITGQLTIITPPPSRMDPGGRLYSLQNLKKKFARFAREVIFFTKPQNFLPRFAREVIFFTKSSIFSRASRGDVIFFTKTAAKIDRFLNVFGPFPP